MRMREVWDDQGHPHSQTQDTHHHYLKRRKIGVYLRRRKKTQTHTHKHTKSKYNKFIILALSSSYPSSSFTKITFWVIFSIQTSSQLHAISFFVIFASSNCKCYKTRSFPFQLDALVTHSHSRFCIRLALSSPLQTFHSKFSQAHTLRGARILGGDLEAYRLLQTMK